MTLDLAFAVSMLLGVFGMATMWMATGHHVKQRRFAPVIGLSGQFAWGWYAVLLGPKAGGLWILIALYSIVYMRGIVVQWDLRRWLWRKFGTSIAGRCAGCGRTLTQEEKHFYISHCNECEGISMQELDEAA